MSKKKRYIKHPYSLLISPKVNCRGSNEPNMEHFQQSLSYKIQKEWNRLRCYVGHVYKNANSPTGWND